MRNQIHCSRWYHPGVRLLRSITIIKLTEVNKFPTHQFELNERADNRAAEPLVFAVRVPLTARALTMQALLWRSRTSVANSWSKHSAARQWAKRETKRVHARICLRVLRVTRLLLFLQPQTCAAAARANFKKKNCNCSDWLGFMLFLRCFGFCVYKRLLKGGKTLLFCGTI